VIAYRRGSVPEVIEEDVSGFVVDSIDEAVGAVRRAADLNRAKVRAEFERRFTAERMAHDYVDIYEHLLAARPRPAVFAMTKGGYSARRAIGLSPAPELMESYREVPSANSSTAVLTRQTRTAGKRYSTVGVCKDESVRSPDVLSKGLAE
jgi:hypothetical protein